MHLDKSSKTHQRCFKFSSSCIGAPVSKYMSVRNIQTWLKILNQLYIHPIVSFIYLWSLCGSWSKVSVVIRSLEKAGDVYSIIWVLGIEFRSSSWAASIICWAILYEPNSTHFKCHILVTLFSAFSPLRYIMHIYIICWKILKPNLLSLMISKKPVRSLIRWLSSWEYKLP